MRDNTGSLSYSRAGQFELNNLGEIVDPSGRFLQGYQASTTGIILGTIGNITLSTATIAPQATTTSAMEANLNSAATVPATAFDVTDATTYNFSNGITIYDSLGAQHELRLYYVKTSTANTWDLYSQIDGGAATARTDLVFTSSGVLTSGGAQTFSLPITGGAATPQSVAMDFSAITQYRGCIEFDQPDSRWVYSRVVSKFVGRFGRASRGAVFQRPNQNPCPDRAEPIYKSEWTDTFR